MISLNYLNLAISTRPASVIFQTTPTGSAFNKPALTSAANTPGLCLRRSGSWKILSLAASFNAESCFAVKSMAGFLFLGRMSPHTTPALPALVGVRWYRNGLQAGMIAQERFQLLASNKPVGEAWLRGHDVSSLAVSGIKKPLHEWRCRSIATQEVMLAIGHSIYVHWLDPRAHAVSLELWAKILGHR